MPLHRSSCSLIALICCLVFGSVANAADQGITGKKLLLESNPKMVLLSKDALVIPGANGSPSDPRCVANGGSGSGASVKLSNGFDTVTLSMPCANWSANSAGTLYKYKDTTGTPKVGKLKAGLLKVVSPGMGGFPVPNGLWTVTAEVTFGTDKYCLSFIGTGDGDKFLVKDTAAGSCAPSQTCGNNVREGTEACDGTDSCPGVCSPDCSSCALSLPCGNNVREGTEQCDGPDATACPGLCLPDCTCAPTSPCGDNIRAGSEECDGTDANACPGQCLSGCTCPHCGNQVTEGSEECDATPAPECATGFCNTPFSCTCYVAECGNGIRDPDEECDGFDDFDCPSSCQANCTCPQCGNNVVESGEECDPPGSECGVPGTCNPGCLCDTSICGISPSCGGTCPPGGSCADFVGCVCLAGSCGSSPSCGGSCPAGYQCTDMPSLGCTCRSL